MTLRGAIVEIQAVRHGAVREPGHDGRRVATEAKNRAFRSTSAFTHQIDDATHGRLDAARREDDAYRVEDAFLGRIDCSARKRFIARTREKIRKVVDEIEPC